MLLLLLFLVLLTAAAYGLSWLVDQPGSIAIDWGGYHIETSMLVGVGALLATFAALMLAWAIVAFAIGLPSRMKRRSRERKRARGYRALSRGIIAAAVGDATTAKRAAREAEGALDGEPLARLLKAEAAQLEGDRGSAERAFHEMTLEPETRLLGLRGLHIEARRRNDAEAAYHFAQAAHQIAPLPWAGNAVLEHHAGRSDWQEARVAVEANLKAKAIDLATAQRLRAVVETALALEKREDEPAEALRLARLALKRAPDLVPAIALAARLLSRQGERRKALKLIESAWAANPHPDLAQAYLDAAPGESNSERLTRVSKLAQSAPNAAESRLLLARTALAARDFAKAREALAPLVAEGQRPTAQTCMSMAELEDAERGPGGPVREWLARASRAPRDPAWIADGVISKSWAPVSPVTGKLDAFVWKAPPEPDGGLTEDGRAGIPAAFLSHVGETQVSEPAAVVSAQTSDGAAMLEAPAASTV